MLETSEHLFRFNYTKVDLELDPAINSDQEHRLTSQSKDDPSTILDMDLRTGDFLFKAEMAKYRLEGDTPNFVFEQEADEVAMEHLQSLDMLVPRDKLLIAHIGRVNMGGHRRDGLADDYHKLTTVRYGRQLGGLPLHGASRIIVHLGENGALAGLVRRWSPVAGTSLAPGTGAEGEGSFAGAL